jgi:hypothetical protein
MSGGAPYIDGNLYFIEGGLAQSGPLAGDGYFLAVKFNCESWSDYDDVRVGLDPSAGTDLVSIIDDPDKNGVFKVSNTSQVFKVVATDGTDTVTKTYSLAGLVLETE